MVLFPKVTDGAVHSIFVKKACFILLHQIKLPIKPLSEAATERGQVNTKAEGGQVNTKAAIQRCS